MTAEQEQTWGELGPCMKALPNERWRSFVRHLVSDTKGHGAVTRAARAAGFGKANTKSSSLSKQAHVLAHDERVVAAIAEESRKVLRVAHPQAVAALFNVINDPTHRDHMRPVAALLDRADPVTISQKIDVTHRHVDADQEGLEELRALRQIGATREKLIELFGGNGLARLERLEAADMVRRADNAKLIEHNTSEQP